MTRQDLLARIRDLSTDEVAPAAKDYPYLLKCAQMYFGTWRAACRAAGVTPRKQASFLQDSTVPREPRVPTPRMREFFHLLAIAARYGKVTKEMIDCCMKAVARGQVSWFFEEEIACESGGSSL